MRTETSAAPLVTLRIGFGLMMVISVVRFWSLGWIDKLYLQPTFFFSYRYFEWIRPLGDWTYVLFGITALAAACILFGYRYRMAMLVFFLSFTYCELMDKTTYLNHYYFVSLFSLLLLFLPMPGGLRAGKTVPKFYVQAVKIFVAVVYFYAGLAKLNSDWLLHAQPLATWLPARYDLPLIGDLLQQRWVHFVFAWGGAAYDLVIPFLLFQRRSRVAGFALVVGFHVVTWLLFPIGMFPFIMIVAATVFLPPAWHVATLTWLSGLPQLAKRGRRTPASGTVESVDLAEEKLKENFGGVSRAATFLSFTTGRFSAAPSSGTPGPRSATLAKLAVLTILLFHLLFPLRYLTYPGEVFWTEEGYRYSWRVMLMEKAGLATFTVRDGGSDRRATVDNRVHLSVLQEKQMSTQPDFILQYAHYLAEVYRGRGYRDPEVYVESYVALNGRLSQPYVDSRQNLLEVDPDGPVGHWLRPFNHTVNGL